MSLAAKSAKIESLESKLAVYAATMDDLVDAVRAQVHVNRVALESKVTSVEV